MPNHSDMPITVLAVGSDHDVCQTVSSALQNEGYDVIETQSAKYALDLVQQHRPSLIILDVTLPDMSGYELCTRLRAMPYADRTPILFLSGQHGAQHVAQALDCGGDDYLRKPFAMRELNARIRALLRRAKFDEPAGSAPELRLSPADNSVEIDGRHIVLTRTEFQLLRYLCENANRHHTASQLLESLWNYPPGRGDTALVRNHVRNLRRKIEHDPDRPSIIISSHGRGYTVNACLSS